MKRDQSAIVKKGRINELEIPEGIEPYSFEDTVKEISKILPWNQGTNRKVFKDKRLYFSIVEHSNTYTLYGDKIAEKAYVIFNNEDCKCICGDIRKFNTFGRGYSKCMNKECSERRFYGAQKWKDELDEDQFKKKYAKSYHKGGSNHSKEWFIHKFGETEGIIRYEKYRQKMTDMRVREMMKTGVLQSSKSADCFFKKLIELGYEGACDINGGEKCFFVNGKVKDRNMIFVDFIYGNKIIEYDGEYWHDEEVDKQRDKFLNDRGFQVLRISHLKAKKNIDHQIEKCVRFLNEV